MTEQFSNKHHLVTTPAKPLDISVHDMLHQFWLVEDYQGWYLQKKSKLSWLISQVTQTGLGNHDSYFDLITGEGYITHPNTPFLYKDIPLYIYQQTTQGLANNSVNYIPYGKVPGLTASTNRPAILNQPSMALVTSLGGGSGDEVGTERSRIDPSWLNVVC